MATNPSFETTAVLMLLLSLSLTIEQASAINCLKIIALFSDCLPYSFGMKSFPSSECCDGLKSWVSSSKTIQQRLEGCLCLKVISNIPDIDADKMADLPGKCSLDLGFQISRTAPCSNITLDMKNDFP